MSFIPYLSSSVELEGVCPLKSNARISPSINGTIGVEGVRRGVPCPDESEPADPTELPDTPEGTHGCELKRTPGKLIRFINLFEWCPLEESKLCWNVCLLLKSFSSTLWDEPCLEWCIGRHWSKDRPLWLWDIEPLLRGRDGSFLLETGMQCCVSAGAAL